jgi:predicted nucleic acid-binding protein
MRVVADASAMAALIFNEDGVESAAERLTGATVHAPQLLRSELANIALKKARRHPHLAPVIFARLSEALDGLKHIRWHDVPPVDVALLAHVTGLTAYDASYLWLAGWLEADLITLDHRLAAAIEPTLPR